MEFNLGFKGLMLLLCWSGVYCYDINCAFFGYNKKIKTLVIFWNYRKANRRLKISKIRGKILAAQILKTFNSFFIEVNILRE